MTHLQLVSRCAAALVLSAVGGTALAVNTSFDLERLWLDPSARGSLVIGSGETLPAGGARLSLSAGWERSPLVLTRQGMRGRGLFANQHRIGDVVRDRFMLQVTGAVAITSRLEAGVRLPLMLSQNGSDLSASGFPELRRRAVGTFSAMARYGVTQQSEAMPLSSALALEAAFPVGVSNDLNGNPRPYFLPRVEVGHRTERFLVAADLGAALRPHAVSIPFSDELHDEITAGAVLATVRQPLRYEVSLRGAFNANGLGAHAELLGGARWAIRWFELYALAGPGFGSSPGTPTFRALVGLALFRPEEAPPAPKQAAAPPPQEPPPPPPPPPKEEPPPPPPPPKEEPAPPPPAEPAAPPKAEIKGEKIEIHEKVFFATGKSTIDPRSHSLLDEVAKLIVDNPQVGKIRIEGHTDDRGSAELNRRLSQARAEAVQAYLVSKGVDPARLEAQGFGPDRPAATNKTAAGREANRRVEFAILGLPKSS